MDFGLITALASTQIPEITTYTVGFDRFSASGMEYVIDERPAAEHMSYLFKTRHYEMVLKAGDMERCLKQLVWHLEKPRVGQSYPNFYASDLAGRFSKVVLVGTGGDKMFGGYPWRYYHAVNNRSFEHYIDNYFNYWQRMLSHTEFSNVLSKIAGGTSRDHTRDIFRDVFYNHESPRSEPEDCINHSLYFEARTFLHGLLVVEDKLSMAHSLETRVPFLDNDLVDFAMKLPVNLKLKNIDEAVRIDENEHQKDKKYFLRTRDGKLLLRDVISRYVPSEISNGVKQGFSAPDGAWYKGDSIDYVRETLLSPNARIYDWLDRTAVLPLVQEHLDGKANRRLLIWSLLYFEEWCSTFLSTTTH